MVPLQSLTMALHLTSYIFRHSGMQVLSCGSEMDEARAASRLLAW